MAAVVAAGSMLTGRRPRWLLWWWSWRWWRWWWRQKGGLSAACGVVAAVSIRLTHRPCHSSNTVPSQTTPHGTQPKAGTSSGLGSAPPAPAPATTAPAPFLQELRSFPRRTSVLPVTLSHFLAASCSPFPPAPSPSPPSAPLSRGRASGRAGVGWVAEGGGEGKVNLIVRQQAEGEGDRGARDGTGERASSAAKRKRSRNKTIA